MPETSEPMERGPEAEEAIDWKAEARRWEDRAKRTREKLEAANVEVESYRSAARYHGERAEEARAEAERLRLEVQRDAMVREVAGAYGVDAGILARMVGDTREDMEANAARLAISVAEGEARRWSGVNGSMAARAQAEADRLREESERRPAHPMTREEILAIRDPGKQLEAMRDNPHALD